MTDSTPPTPPTLTAYRAPAPAVLSWNHNPPPRPTNAYVQILSQCVDCGREMWWTRRESKITVPAGRDMTYRLLTATHPAYPITDEPRCHDCTAWRALPWWRRWLEKHDKKGAPPWR